MDPIERLTAAQVATREGRYDEALREFVWFHEHALEHSPSLYGVRLSFALAYWMELAQSFPEAQRKLEEIRDRKAALLASGQGDRYLFHDVVSINEYLDDEIETYRLFKRMDESAPLVAAASADAAQEAIVKAGDFELAAKYLGEPEDALLEYGERLNESVEDFRNDPKLRALALDAYVRNYAGQVEIIMATLEGLGRSNDAVACREWAIAIVDSKSIRKRVSDALENR